MVVEFTNQSVLVYFELILCFWGCNVQKKAETPHERHFVCHHSFASMTSLKGPSRHRLITPTALSSYIMFLFGAISWTCIRRHSINHKSFINESFLVSEREDRSRDRNNFDVLMSNLGIVVSELRVGLRAGTTEGKNYVELVEVPKSYFQYSYFWFVLPVLAVIVPVLWSHKKCSVSYQFFSLLGRFARPFLKAWNILEARFSMLVRW
jgi:hypothetical protein